MPNLIFVDGAEQGVVSDVGAGIVTSISTGTAPICDSVIKRSGAYSYKFVTDGVNKSFMTWTIPGGGSGAAIGRAYVYIDSGPTTSSLSLFGFNTGLGITGIIRASSSGVLQAAISTSVQSGPAWTTGTWYRIDMQYNATSSSFTLDWQINGVAQTQVTFAAASASTVDSLRLGNSGSVAATFHTDDIWVSQTPADYPLGVGAVIGLSPNIDGTHVNDTHFQRNGGTAIGTTGFNRLDEVPIDSSASYIQQVTANAASYLEFGFDDTTATGVYGVRALVAYHSAGALANNGRTDVLSGATSSAIHTGSMATLALTYDGAMVTPSGGGTAWTTALVNAVIARIGKSTDVIDIPYWDALFLQVAVDADPGGGGGGGGTIKLGIGESDAVASETAVGYEIYSAIGSGSGIAVASGLGTLITTGWSANNITAAIETTKSKSKAHSVKLTSVGTGTNHYLKSKAIAIVPNTKYIASVYVYNPETAPGTGNSTKGCALSVTTMTSGSVVLVTTETPLNAHSTTGWERLLVSFTSGATAALAEVRLLVYDKGSAWFDGANLAATDQNLYETSYVDGRLGNGYSFA